MSYEKPYRLKQTPSTQHKGVLSTLERADAVVPLVGCQKQPDLLLAHLCGQRLPQRRSHADELLDLLLLLLCVRTRKILQIDDGRGDVHTIGADLDAGT